MNNNFNRENEEYYRDNIGSERPGIYDDGYDGDEFEEVDSRGFEEEIEPEYHTESANYSTTFIEEDVEEYQPPVRVRKRKKSKLKKVALTVLLFAFCLFLVVVIIGWAFSFSIPDKTVFLIMATDQDGTRTDTLMLGSFDKNTKDISLASIPRDTYVTVSDEMYEKMNEEYPEPGNRSMKINSIHHYGGEKYGTELLLEQVEAMIGTDVHYYVKVDFEAFRYIIDSVGGIDFYVPQNMEYHDPLQNLHISLKEGQQHLNGEQAEQVLRFRSGYANADLGRVDVQQQFMKAFIGQVMSKGNVFSKAEMFFNILFKYGYIDTDAGLFDAVSYAFVLGDIDIANMQTHTLPGRSASKGGQSVYILDESGTDEIISSMVD